MVLELHRYRTGTGTGAGVRLDAEILPIARCAHPRLAPHARREIASPRATAHRHGSQTCPNGRAAAHARFPQSGGGGLGSRLPGLRLGSDGGGHGCCRHDGGGGGLGGGGGGGGGCCIHVSGMCCNGGCCGAALAASAAAALVA